ncbi:hypothetical protein [uncultured Tateyamaria sp.]|uniref:hypothetical protein n=1 Tax=uncultured Tateyamaria sp. TaxID=455651 RepID=UPI0026254D90|nr:hypothetical protein [uncultured Tateyamaria sp.]
MSDPQNQFLIVVGVDIEGYSKKSVNQQYRAQQKLESWIVTASNAAEILATDGELRWIDSGDGGFLLFETFYDKAFPFLTKLYREINEHNLESRPDSTINVRSAIHCDDSLRWEGQLGPRYAGNALVTCARILDSMNREYSNQVVCSGYYIDKAFASRKTAEERRLPDHVDKHGFIHQVWNLRRANEFGVQPEDKDLHEKPTEWYWNPSS